MGALRSDGAISGPSNRFTDLVEGGEQASRRAVRRRFFRALNVCDTPRGRGDQAVDSRKPFGILGGGWRGGAVRSTSWRSLSGRAAFGHCLPIWPAAPP